MIHSNETRPKKRKFLSLEIIITIFNNLFYIFKII